MRRAGPAAGRTPVSVVVMALAFTAACRCAPSAPPEPEYVAFGAPEPVAVTGYGGDAMEPFISRDGGFLFFNNDKVGVVEKDLFYATRVDDLIFTYQGPISAVNSAAVDGVPSMDASGVFYYVSLAGYAPPADFATLHSGTWTGSTVTGSAPLSSLIISTPLVLYFDIDASPAGSTLYICCGDFRSGGGVPTSADIFIAEDPGSGFALAAAGPSIMAEVNTDALEYAPAISADGLELYFTRMYPATAETRMYRAVRASADAAFGTPQRVTAVTGFAEGPAFSPDEKSLYYHKKNPGTERFEIWRVTRE